MADISHADLFENLGNDGADFAKDLANGAINFGCELYHDFPWFMTSTPVIGSYNKGFFEHICKPRPPGLPPPPPAPAFPGGQCDRILYNIRCRFDMSNGQVVYAELYNFFGAISGECQTRQTATYSNGETGWTAVVKTHGALWHEGYKETLYEYWIPQAGWIRVPRDVSVKASIDAVWRVDNKPDNCGDLPTGHPHIVPPAERLTKNVTVNVNGGDSYVIPVTLVNSSNSYNLEFNAGDIHLNVDLGGVSFGTNPLGNAVTNINKTVNNLSTSVNNISANVTNVANTFAGALVFATPANPQVHDTKSASGNSLPAQENGEDNLAWVTLELTLEPSNRKSQSGGKAQEVVYAGWFQFSQGKWYFPRQPIHFKYSIFKAPAGATGYSYTLYEGFRGVVTEFRSKDTM